MSVDKTEWRVIGELVSRVTLAAWLALLSIGCNADVWNTSGSQPARQVLAPAPGSPIGVRFAAGGIALGDVNDDDRMDLVVWSETSPTMAVLLGRGDGQFRATPASPIQLQDPVSELALGDVNRDGRLDLVLGRHDSYRIELHLGNGTGSFGLAPNLFIATKDGQHPHTHGLALGDLNHDGNVDLVTSNTTDSDVAVALGDGLGGFAPAADSPFAVGQGPYPLALGDLNGDGDLDLAVTSTMNTNGQSGDSLTVLLGDGRGGFMRSQVAVKTPNPWFVAIGDLDGDHKPDLASSHWESSKLTVLIGNGNGSFAEVDESPFDLGHAAWYIGIADINGDGYDDVAAAAGDSVRLMLGDGRGGLEPAPGSPYPTSGGTWRLAIGDINGDGRSDVATSNQEGESVAVLLAR